MTDEKRNEPINARARALINAAMDRQSTPAELRRANIGLLREHIAHSSSMQPGDIKRAAWTIEELQK